MCDTCRLQNISKCNVGSGYTLAIQISKFHTVSWPVFFSCGKAFIYIVVRPLLYCGSIIYTYGSVFIKTQLLQHLSSCQWFPFLFLFLFLSLISPLVTYVFCQVNIILCIPKISSCRSSILSMVILWICPYLRTFYDYLARYWTDHHICVSIFRSRFELFQELLIDFLSINKYDPFLLFNSIVF